MIVQKSISECHWEITKRCNLTCIHCIAATGDYEELDTKDSLNVIDNLYSLGCRELYFTGGEPLVRKDIFDILKKAKEKGFKVGLLTNSTLISAKNIKKIKSFVDELGISIDGASPIINDQIRGYGIFNKIIRSILLIKKYEIPFSLYVTINNLNLCDLENILKIAEKLEAQSTRFNEITFKGRAKENRKILEISKSDQNLLNNLLEKNLPECLNQYKNNDKVGNICDINPQTIFLSAKGLIYPCSEIFQEMPLNYLGNILKITSEFFEKYESFYIKNIKKQCPHRFLFGKNSVICLNSSSIKCSFSM